MLIEMASYNSCNIVRCEMDEREYKLTKLVIVCVTTLLMTLFIIGAMDCQANQVRYLECVNKGVDLRLCRPFK